MTSILLLTEGIYYNIWRCIYLRNEREILIFFLHFLNLDLLFKFSKKKMAVIADVFLNLYFSKNVVR